MELSDSDIIVSLTDYATALNIPLDTLLALYLVLGKNIFFVFTLFQGMTLKFPKVKNLKSSFNTQVQLLELKAKKYKVGDVWKNTLDLAVGDIISVGNREIAIVLPIQEVLGHYYTLLVK